MKKLLLLTLQLAVLGCGGAAKKNPPPPPVAAVPPNVPELPKDDAGCQIGQTVGYSGEVEKLINDKCTSCHPAYDSFAVAGEPNLANQIVERVNLLSGDVRRMPKFPAKELSVNEKTLLSRWKQDGFQEVATCKSVDNQAFLDLDAIESFILGDLDRVGSKDARENSRYLLLSHRKNQQIQLEDFKMYVQGMNKGVNSLSSTDDIVLVTPIDPAESIYRIDLRQYGLTAADWNAVLLKEPYNFISQTSRGLQIAQLTATAQPWLHGDNFSFTSLGDPELYNQLTDMPATLVQHQTDFDVNQVESFAKFESRLLGFNGSPISENKNRLLLRLPGDNNTTAFWQTFDPNSQFLETKNLFEFPLVQVGIKQFVSDASETIAEKDNGLHQYGLFNAVGALQTEAPGDVVVNNLSPFNAIIKNGLDCMRCHTNGLIPAIDQLSAQAKANASEFPNGDFDLINAYYKSQATNSALFISDSKRYDKALEQLGIDTTSGIDPVNFWLDGYRTDWTVNDAAAFVFMTPEEFCINLNSSSKGKAQIGTLCAVPSGTITFAQWQATFPIILQDFRLGLDPIDK